MIKTCPSCGKSFDAYSRVAPTVLPQFQKATAKRVVYCSESCARTHENKKYYARHRDEVLERVKANK